ncbi:probable methyltransferase-like protein 25 isoform X2 [Ylistrum balloti]|uniref:probable methyltransferase-like protein 25 isoform X2 n=1 Tax=Ylistrum balloti TaxID=509963 RepID=UPI0029059D35|nr:probable methyltransferase-like protein 25 isoform X2 [Ylistrum balloti]
MKCDTDVTARSTNKYDGSPEGLDLKKVQGCLDSVLSVTQSYLPFCNAHSNDFIIESHWDNHIPPCIREELLHMTDQELCDFPAKYIDMLENHVKAVDSSDNRIVKGSSKWIHEDLNSYLQAVCGTNLKSLGVLVDIEYLFSKTGQVKDDLQIKNFMTNKKSHEVDIMTCVGSRLANTMGTDVIVDMGSGKGYLSTQLALKCHKTVVGIDAQMINTKGAIKRAKILTRQWKGLVRNAQELHDTGVVTKKSKKLKKKLKKERMSAMMVGEGDTKKAEKMKTTWEDFDGLDTIFGEENNEAFVESAMSTEDSVREQRISASTVCRQSPPGTPGSTVTCWSENQLNMGVDISTKSEIENFSNMTLEEAKHDVSSSSKICSSTHGIKDQKFLPEIALEVAQVPSMAVKTENPHFDSKVSQKKRQKTPDKSQKPRTYLPYVPLTLFVDTSMDLMKVVSEALSDHPSSSSVMCDKPGETTLMLTGLHTCGALGSSMLELFVNNPTVKVLCGVGCCYHSMREMFGLECQQFENDFPVGFPMSCYLRDKKVYLGRIARNFASQSIYRQAQDSELSFATFPRCLLQKILLDVVGHIDPDWKGLRGLGDITPDMYQYVVKAFTKLGLPTDKITPDLVEEYCDRYKDDKRKLAAFRQLKSVLAPTIEALVLLDRACYLLEQECVGEVYMVQMFDPVISPRCYGS